MQIHRDPHDFRGFPHNLFQTPSSVRQWIPQGHYLVFGYRPRPTLFSCWATRSVPTLGQTWSRSKRCCRPLCPDPSMPPSGMVLAQWSWASVMRDALGHLGPNPCKSAVQVPLGHYPLSTHIYNNIFLKKIGGAVALLCPTMALSWILYRSSHPIWGENIPCFKCMFLLPYCWWAPPTIRKKKHTLKTKYTSSHMRGGTTSSTELEWISKR